MLSGTERGRRSRRRPFDLLRRTLAATYLLSDQATHRFDVSSPGVGIKRPCLRIRALKTISFKRRLSEGWSDFFFFFFIFSNQTNRHASPYFHNRTFVQRRLNCTSRSWSLDGPVGITVRPSNLLFIQVKTLTEALKFIFFWLSN